MAVIIREAKPVSENACLNHGQYDSIAREMEEIAHTFSTHLDFTEARLDSLVWDVMVADGL